MDTEPRMMTRTIAGNIVAFIVAAVVLLFFLLALGTGVVWAAIAAAGAYGLSLLVVPGLPSRRRTALPPGLDKQLIGEVVGEARVRLEGLRRKSRLLSDQRVRLKALSACTTADKIVVELERDPRRIQSARPFLTYYLDATDRIVTQYMEISARKASGESIQQTLAKVEPTLDVIDRAFERQLESLLHDDVIDLDAEISLLQKTAKLEGVTIDLATTGALEPAPAAQPDEPPLLDRGTGSDDEHRTA